MRVIIIEDGWIVFCNAFVTADQDQGVSTLEFPPHSLASGYNFLKRIYFDVTCWDFSSSLYFSFVVCNDMAMLPFTPWLHNFVEKTDGH